MRDQLALRIKNGDKQAFELLFRKCFVGLCCFANKFLNEPEEAREVVQDVFTKLWEKRQDIESEGTLIAYLFKITQNNSINILRRRQVNKKCVEIYRLIYVDHKEISPYQSLLASELSINFTRAMRKIPPKCRRIFELSRMEGLKYHQIAAVLGISIKTVEAQMSKALQILRIELRDYI